MISLSTLREENRQRVHCSLKEADYNLRESAGDTWWEVGWIDAPLLKALHEDGAGMPWGVVGEWRGKWITDSSLGEHQINVSRHYVVLRSMCNKYTDASRDMGSFYFFLSYLSTKRWVWSISSCKRKLTISVHSFSNGFSIKENCVNQSTATITTILWWFLLTSNFYWSFNNLARKLFKKRWDDFLEKF